jgi:hypothetical protein
MKVFRIKLIKIFFSFIVAVLVLNLSIDPPDLMVNLDSDIAFEEDLSINEMESLAEVILEKGFEMENALPETDDQDPESLVKKVEIFLTQCFVSEHNIFNTVSILPRVTKLFCIIYSNIYLDFFSPPPEDNFFLS